MVGRTASTDTGISRLELIGGLMRGGRVSTRPPWALPEAAFQDLCTGCNDCIGACPTAILKKSRGGYPVVDFTGGECTFCGDCVPVCHPGALVRTGDGRPWNLLATVTASCLSVTGVTCRICGDHCDGLAISFTISLGGRSRPIVDQALCTGCGACVAPCPVEAIAMISETMES